LSNLFKSSKFDKLIFPYISIRCPCISHGFYTLSINFSHKFPYVFLYIFHIVSIRFPYIIHVCFLHMFHMFPYMFHVCSHTCSTHVHTPPHIKHWKYAKHTMFHHEQNQYESLERHENHEKNWAIMKEWELTKHEKNITKHEKHGKPEPLEETTWQLKNITTWKRWKIISIMKIEKNEIFKTKNWKSSCKKKIK